MAAVCISCAWPAGTSSARAWRSLPSLVRHATRRAAEAGLTDRLRYLVGDMRDLTAAVGDETFDAVTLLSGSFGFFDDETNQRVLDGMDVKRTNQGAHHV